MADLNRKKIAILSTGNGGQSMAAYFTSQGFDVSLYAREQERVDMFRTNRFTVSGVVNCTVYINEITCDMEQAIKDAFLIMVTTPAQYHTIVAKDMAPYLANDQVVLLNPGRTFGTFEFEKTLRENGCNTDYVLGEAETFAFTCRCNQVGFPMIYSIKDDCPVAAHRPDYIDKLIDAVSIALECFSPAKDVLTTGLSNMGVIFHPMPFIMNFTRVEQGEQYLHYREGITPMVAERLEALDAERMALARALGAKTVSAKDWLTAKYGSRGINLYETIQETDAYAEVYAPTNIYSRYVFEDIPTGCVPMFCVGREVGIDTPIIKALIDWASALYGFDFMGRGRNESKMDLSTIVK